MKWMRGILVVCGALLITALGIDAADTLHGSQGTLLSQVASHSEGKCPSGMSVIENVPSMTCADTYEASASEKCPVANPDQTVASRQNSESKECLPQSKKGMMPWRFVTRDQAMQLCARAGKRLPTNEEWYNLSLGMTQVEESCNVSSKNIAASGARESCVSPQGVVDLVGNVWEWMSDDVINGTYRSSKVPVSGYVAQVDTTGVATVSTSSPQDLFDKDYFWSNADGAFGIIRGGYYDSGSDAGIYSAHADALPTTASIGIGFRCVK